MASSERVICDDWITWPVTFRKLEVYLAASQRFKSNFLSMNVSQSDCIIDFWKKALKWTYAVSFK